MEGAGSEGWLEYTENEYRLTVQDRPNTAWIHLSVPFACQIVVGFMSKAEVAIVSPSLELMVMSSMLITVVCTGGASSSSRSSRESCDKLTRTGARIEAWQRDAIACWFSVHFSPSRVSITARNGWWGQSTSQPLLSGRRPAGALK